MSIVYKTELGSTLKDPGLSPHYKWANTEISWLPLDSRDTFLSNMKNQSSREKLISMGWTETSITYKFNEQGFRSDPFQGEGAVFLGCSFTQGIGIDWERTWSYLVARKLGLKCWNLGIGGSSNDTAFRLAYHWIPILKPKFVFYLPTVEYRFEFITETTLLQFLPSKVYVGNDGYFYDRWLSVRDNSRLNYLKNVAAIKHICNENSIPCITVERKNRFHNPHMDLGRDLLHNGPTWNKDIAGEMLSQLNNKDVNK